MMASVRTTLFAALLALAVTAHAQEILASAPEIPAVWRGDDGLLRTQCGARVAIHDLGGARPRLTAQEWADRMDTIAYTIVCGIGPRVPRRYLG